MVKMNDVLKMPVPEYLEYLYKTYVTLVPEDIMANPKETAKLLSVYANNYVYLVELASFLKAYARDAKRKQEDCKGSKAEKEFKRMYEDYNDKANLTIEFYKAVNNQYAALSRMITVMSDSLKELNMLEYHM